MKIHWHKRAVTQLHEIENYVCAEFGEKKRQEFMDDMEHAVMPAMGSIDPLFAHRKRAYRSIIVRRLNKIVYYTKDDVIFIAAVWDCRREPVALANQVK